ncbi:hypothetical protein XI03_31180 [Bradyrhizobium sp. CCBAU 65884]|nr:hypothetical protein [Bradyrhizobium sp. CCBAU 65884]
MTDMRQLVPFAKYPIFALAPGQRRVEFKDRVGDKFFYFFVTTDDASYIPTLSDSDILIYLVSLLTASFNRGEILSTELPFRPNDALRFLGRHTGGRQRSFLAASLRRLERANFIGNIPLGSTVSLPPGTLIERFDWPEGDDLPRTIHVPSWMLHQVQQKQILRIDPASLRLRGLERCINEWARVHASRAVTSPWTIKISYAWFKAGGLREPRSEGGFRKFRFALRRVVERNALPGYHLSLCGTGKDASLAIQRLAVAQKASLAASVPEFDVRETLVLILDNSQTSECDA